MGLFIMAEFPAMPLWTDAYLADTGHLSTLEHGVYLLLLMTMWRAGGTLPNDEKKLARFARLNATEWKKVRENIMEFFEVEGDEIRQRRLKKELEFIRDKKRKASESARSKWLKKQEADDADAEERISETDAHARVTTPTPTPIDKKKAPSEPKKGSRISDDFAPDLDAAVTLGLRPEVAMIEAAKFKDYWKAAAGAKGVKLDWPATWRNWVRSALQRQGARGSPSAGRTAFRQHQDDVMQDFERAAGHGRASDDDRQPAFDLGRENYRRE